MGGMKKDDLAKRLARQSHLTKAAAADQLDRMVHEILKQLRRGKDVALPGLGKFTPGKKLKFEFEEQSLRKGSESGKKQ
jgi:nucleoid DNA-binding protein